MYAIQTSRQPAVLPGFYAVRIAHSVQADVGFDDLLADSRLVSAGAGADDLLERRIDGHAEDLAAEDLSE